MHHINTKVLLGLGGAALLALIAAFILVANRQPVNDNAVTAALAIPELQGHVNDVQSITLKIAEDKTAVTLAKNERGWVVNEKYGYPADTGKLRELLLKLSGAKLLEQKTANPERYAILGVSNIKDKDAKGVLLTLNGLKPPNQLIIGDFSSRSDGAFVRRPGEQQSWLAKGNLTIERDPVNWLDKALVDLPTARIFEVTITKPGNQAVRIFKNQATDEHFQLAGLPKGRELQNDTILYEMASALSNLTLSDVAPRSVKPLPAENQLLKAHYAAFDGFTLELNAWRDNDNVYAQLLAGLDQTIADTRIQTEQTKIKEEYAAKQNAESAKDSPKTEQAQAAAPNEAPPLAISDPKKDRLQRLDPIKAEIDTLNRRFEGWSFIIAPYKYSTLEKSMEDLLKPATAVKKPG